MKRRDLGQLEHISG